MPRASRIPAILISQKPPSRLPSNAPRLWNAKERIKTNVGLKQRDMEKLKESPHIQYEKSLERSNNEATYKRWLKLRYAEPMEGKDQWWKNESSMVLQYMENHPQLCKVSEDVQIFISENPQLTAHQISYLLRNPARYFSIPKNVPFEDRKQIYFPDPKDAVILLRTKHLGPRYAAFFVPLHFNKLDMRDYLKSVYNVDILHIRSTIIQAKVKQIPTMSKVGRGYWARPASRKKMTVLLAKPFVYPEEIKDLSEWDHEHYWDTQIAREKEYKKQADTTKPNEDFRAAMKSQAKAVVRNLKTSREWTPTWKELASNQRAMQGAVTAIPPKKSASSLPLPPPERATTGESIRSLPE
ncbi:hypothetical protein LTR84_009649 [Exophiala bonariae]|uniref:Large ribosomal subunit protein uL23m n=1 Tax=Exophiala bonariae TaxID=1690606 RepID=A0AAV9NJB4_9EURO|nr:hypothetical protein LTR84_009649 [Exophiala bonariae]